MADSAKGLVIITGASSGIGEEAAKAFSAAGHPLLLLARRVERMEALALPNTICAKVDVTDGAAFQAAVDEAEAKYGPTECIVNNAGVMLLASMTDQDSEEWSKMINVNIIGVLNGIKAVLKGMQERKRGTIINISSIAGRKTFPNHAVYCATKFAVHALTEGLREECSSTGVRCVTIAPGVVETELLSHTTHDDVKEGYEAWKRDGLKGQPLRAPDVVSCIMFAFNAPPHMCVREIVVAPVFQQA